MRLVAPSDGLADVLDAAARIVADRGVDGLTMDRLARVTGRSRATLYRHSGGRQAVLDALAGSGVDVGDRAGTRARILAGAREVFGRAGFEGASIEDIAGAARVGVATVYRCFGDKDGLVAAFLDEMGPRRAARDAREAATGDLRADLQRLAERMLTAMHADAPLVRLLILETLRGGSLLPRVRAKSPTRVINLVTSLLQQHRAAGRLRDLPPRELAQAFGGMLLGFGVVAPILRGETASDPAHTARTLTTIFLDGVLAPGKRKARA